MQKNRWDYGDSLVNFLALAEITQEAPTSISGGRVHYVKKT